jgi:hypothetical protein
MKIINKVLVKFILLSSLLVSESFAQKGKLGVRYWHSEGETEWSHCASTACGGAPTGLGIPFNSLGDPSSKLNYSGTKAGIGRLAKDTNCRQPRRLCRTQCSTTP